MKNHIYFIALVFVSSIAFGQRIPESYTFVGNVLSDTTNLNSNIFKDVLPPILNSKNTIEIRFLIAPDMAVDTLKTLYYDGQWNAKKYNLDTKKELTVDINNKKQKLAEIFQKLIDNDIFNLRDDSSINIAPTYINLQTEEIEQMIMGLLHSTMYIVQFKVGNYFRLYGFDSPEIYAESHPKITEFKNYSNIVEIFKAIK